MNELKAIVGQLARSGSPSVLATLVTAEGSSYRRPGARMLICEGRPSIGSISGGCLEEDLIQRAASVAALGRAVTTLYDTAAENDLLWGMGLGCHGTVRILLEPLPPRPPWAAVVAENLRVGRATRLDVVWESPEGPLGTALASGAAEAPAGVFRETVEPPAVLAIFGAGDDAQPLARQALRLGWRVTVADSRPKMPTPSRFPGVSALVLGPVDELVARAAPQPGTLAVVMTHRYLHDLPLLRHLLPLPLAYLGLLGPRMRADRILADLAAGGLAITAEMGSRLRAPVGLDLGADGPDGVALSIIAEMAAVVAGRDGRPLRERTLPIHA
jgi:xanthine/CO dehydrogenase XdhC/CoxF family maturation factor